MPHGEMTTSRLEAFSDGVIAIIVTIMVLELRAPTQPTWPALLKVAPIFISYGLSFGVIALTWYGHQETFRYIRRYDGRLVALNFGSLLVIAVLPFPTAVLGRYGNQPLI